MFLQLADEFSPFVALELLKPKVIFGMISCLGRLWRPPCVAGQGLTDEYVLAIITLRLDIKRLEHVRGYRIVLIEPGICGRNGVYGGL